MAAKNRVTYHEENINANTLKLREVLDTMPRFSKDFFRAIEPNTSAKTRISYVYDIRLFFRFLIQSNPYFKNKDIIKESNCRILRNYRQLILKNI